jgi:hypothetical protein
VLLDHLVKGRNMEAADVVAGRIKSVEKLNQDGDWANSQYLELIPVKVEGLTTAEDKQILRVEAQMDKADWSSSGNGWGNSGKGADHYNWIPSWKGGAKGKKGKGAKGEAKGKKGKGAKGEPKGAKGEGK